MNSSAVGEGGGKRIAGGDREKKGGKGGGGMERERRRRGGYNWSWFWFLSNNMLSKSGTIQ